MARQRHQPVDDVSEPRGGGVIVTPNPYIWSSGPDIHGNEINIAVSWDAGQRTITGITVHRDPACIFSVILIGLGADGSPNSTDKQVDVSGLEGDRVLPANRLTQLASRGLSTVDNVLALQITAV
jgi:hypothetical protein